MVINAETCTSLNPSSLAANVLIVKDELLSCVIPRAYTEKRACNSLCTLRTHPTSYQRPDMLKIESSIRT